MVKKLFLVIVLALGAAAFVPAFAQMSDEAVVKYVQDGLAAGKSQNAMARELMARGVTPEQAERLKSKYASGNGEISAVKTPGTQEERRRSSSAKKERTAGTQDNTYLMESELAAGDMGAVFSSMTTGTRVVDGDSAPMVFGRSVFASKNLTFAPNENLATPENYRLGPGDEVIIDIWGTNEVSLRQTISPDGNISIANVGLISLNGMTVREADAYMRKKLGKIYSVEGDGAKSEIKLTLGSIRTIQVNVMGEVSVPGTYYLSSFSNIYHALYMAGGVSRLGSLRDIQLVRNGKKVASIDVYDFILNGNSSGDVNLMEGDIVLVQPYAALVDISGHVKRPMLYEMKEGETIADLITYAGGFTGDAFRNSLRTIRKNGKEYRVYTVDEPEYAGFKLVDGDEVSVEAMLDRYENKVEVNGAVYRPGIYELGDRINSVRQLITKAEGLRGDAFAGRAILQREKEDLTLEVIPVDLGKLMSGEIADIPLHKNDVLYVSSIHELQDIGYVRVMGAVARPGDHVFAENLTIEDVIIQAGGLLESASTARVDVSRRIKKPGLTETMDTLSENFSFAVKDGLVIDGDQGFILEPYDYVYVRMSPGYSEQRHCVVTGEVVFPGTYALGMKNERLSDFVRKAGGLTLVAYVKGARLIRTMSEQERALMEATLKTASRGADSLDVSKLELASEYQVGIDLEAALANPGSEIDLVLREGDRLEIPEMVSTVRISGNVLYPNTVIYNGSMKVKDYIAQAGGFGFQAKKNRAYIVYYNGTVAKASLSKKGVVAPGCEIIVPQKRRKGNTLAEILSISTTAASLGTMIATIGNIIK